MITLSEILSHFASHQLEIVNGKVNSEIQIIGPRTINDAGEKHITFLSKKLADQAFALLSTTKAPLVVLDKDLYEGLTLDQKSVIITNLVLSAEPKKDFIACLEVFFKQKTQPYIHPTSVIHPSATLGKNVSIGAYTVIDENVSIGDNTIIGAHVHVQSGVRIGSNVNIRSQVTIGNWGFGFVKNEDGSNVSFPHYGSVIIEDDVQIGSGTCVDRGALGDTIIKKGVKIDNLVHVAHNVVIGENSLVIACTMIGGSTVIGDNCWVAPAVILRNGITIGDNATLGMGCLVTKNVDAGESVAGSPAIPLEDFKKLLKIQKDLLKS